MDPGPFDYAARLEAILRDQQDFRKHIVPLCAAETPVSEFVRSFLSHPIHESYAMGGPLRPTAENFIGAEHVLNLHQLTIDLCRAQFGAVYADPRPLSGTGAVTTLLMTLSEPGQRILLQTQDSGGHSSMEPICRRLGLEVLDLPYDYEQFGIDVDACRRLSEEGRFDLVLFAPSDLIYPPRLEACAFPESTTVIYDATQTLGLIATGHVQSPLEAHPRLVLTAGTHKTLPGPSSGLILTKNEEIADRVDAELSPKFVRHSHPHHMAALCAALIEHSEIGPQYSDRIRAYAHILSRSLVDAGLTVLQDYGRASDTHQVFVHVPRHELEDRYARAAGAGITLNMKRRRLFHYSGFRLGVQEIARYLWTESDVIALTPLLAELILGRGNISDLRDRVLELAQLNSFDPAMTINAPV